MERFSKNTIEELFINHADMVDSSEYVRTVSE